ncbi:hypothetical protein JTE90_017694 [Oedothorax gibbosus]|uniref:Reverse transcriptase domain-containing protein n=1 Tax=Oedothorax gibbosus TaxID=931172 RepID=A0AAV6V1A6_9ARAC|nr:hypothetical protein JTE90_017694 [Oedothorax gibbosus]
MEIVLSGLSPLGIAPYIDDIIVASSESVDEHFSKLELVFKRLEAHGLKLKPGKCCACSEIDSCPERINFPSLESEVPANENGTVLSHTEEVGVERPMGFHRHRVTYHITISRASSGQNVQSESRRPPTHSYDLRPRRAGFSYKE